MATKRKPKRATGRTSRPAKRAAPRRVKRKLPETLRARMVTASLTVNSLRRSLDWYEVVLGFTETDRWERDGVLQGLELKAGRTTLLLNQDDWARGRDRKKGEGCRLYFSTIQDLDHIAAGIKARGGVLDHDPMDQPWGNREFAITDPDGFHLTFVQRKR